MAIIYSASEEKANYITHGVGLLVVVLASGFFIFRSGSHSDVLMYVVGILLYAVGAGASYLASFLYHSSPMASVRREKLRRFDHAAIYWHIAGSYSPVLLCGMSQQQDVAWLLFAVVWVAAVLGSFQSFYKLKEHSNLETICFVCMGLVILLAFNKVLYCIGWHSMGWIIAEGVSFITGAVFYSFNKVKYMHTVFHVFVLIGSVCHITALYYILQ